jgi:alkanesulfonate monooxygenase SsuD/methylene tetrahydromethanopterin reductase-like flavin-dependent oxidoreductase (luciferase family)
MRLGYLTHVTGDDPARAYWETIELAIEAERLGFDSFWVAQHHDGHLGGLLGSPLVLLGAIAQYTERIRLGTGVVALPLEDPLRLAEDAAVADALSGGRLELGIGAGADADASDRFGRDHEERHEDCLAALDRLLELLPGDEPESRVWWATGLPEIVDAAADRGVGLLSGRRPDAHPEVEADLARYWTYCQGMPRVALSRPLIEGEGSTETLVRWAEDPALPWAGEIVVQAQPATAPTERHREVLRWVADEIAPRLDEVLGVRSPRERLSPTTSAT